MRKFLLAAALLVWACAGSANPLEDDVVVNVERRGQLFVIDVEVLLDATPEEAWETISDYDHMARFISNIKYSKVLSRDGNHLRVEQRGRASRGVLGFSFENVRDVLLMPPHEIRTKLVSGTLKHAVSITRLVAGPGGTRLINHGEYVPGTWVPPVVGPALIESETREQFGELRAEIARRKGGMAEAGR